MKLTFKKNEINKNIDNIFFLPTLKTLHLNCATSHQRIISLKIHLSVKRILKIMANIKAPERASCLRTKVLPKKSSVLND